MSQFEPISDKLVCLPVEQEEVSDGGIILPQIDDQKTLIPQWCKKNDRFIKELQVY